MTQVQMPPGVSSDEAPPARNLLALSALVLATVGAVLAVLVVAVPGILLLTFVPLVTGFGLALVGFNRGTGRGLAVAAMVISLVFATVGPILFFGAAPHNSTAGTPDAAVPDVSKAIQPGLRVVNENGVGLTVKSVTCGSRTFTDAAGTAIRAHGRFCVVKVGIRNGSTGAVSLSLADVTGLTDRSYPAAAMSGHAGVAGGVATVEPGRSVNASLAFDVPKKGVLDYVLVRPTWALQGPVLVKSS